MLRQFGLYDRDEVKFELKISKRGSAPLGGGEIYLTVPNPKKLRAVVSLGTNIFFIIKLIINPHAVRISHFQIRNHDSSSTHIISKEFVINSVGFTEPFRQRGC